MNREIKFRGFQPELKKWIFGSLVTMPQGGAWILDYQNGFEDRIRINANTVGQFTGLTDKNGKEIYEGDVIIHKGAKGNVHYDCTIAMFMVRFPLLRSIYSFDSMEGPVEIIGNIHDNPDLLK